MRQPPKLSRNQRRKRDYKAMAEKGGESRSAKRARLKAQRVARRPDQRGAHERPCGNVACRSCYRRMVEEEVERRTKPKKRKTARGGRRDG